MTRAAPLALLAALAAVAGPPARAATPALAGGFTCPDRGGPAWREVRTAHFAVQTDLPSGEARALAREVERLFGVVRHGLFRSPPPSPGRLRVVALRSAGEFGLFAAKGVAAFYRRETPLGPTMVVPGELGEAQREVLAHELAHHVAARLPGRRPWWFTEGLAVFMETVGSSAAGSTPAVGGVPRPRHRLVFPWHGGLGPVVAGASAQGEREYALAWSLFHFLVNRRPAGMADLQARYARGQDPAAAWREVFPGWDPATAEGAGALDDEVGRYVAYGKFGYREVRLPPEEPVEERPLGAADAHAIRLSLLPWPNQGEAVAPERLLAELEEALAHDPAHVMALTVRAAAGVPGGGLAAAERAVAAHPDDASAWLLLARLLPQGEGARRLAALAQAARLAPEDPAALNGYAWQLLGDGRWEEALPPARRAVALAPWSPHALDTLAAVLERAGECPGALDAQRRAVDVLAEGWPEEERRPFVERLARLEAGCGAARPAAAPAPP